ncbi:MAG: hypothetical protein GY838_00275 [bacterium]|nr:hypothetical protein [bacterium]
MTEKDDEHIRQLLSEVELFNQNKVLGDFLHDTAGLFVPGFTALPAVSILASDSLVTRMKNGPERWRPGNLLSVKTREESAGDEETDMTFFTPVVDVTIPMIDAEQGKEISKFEKTIELKPNDRWEPIDIHFALLPWDYKREQRTWTPDELIAISHAMEKAGREMTVEMRLRDRAVDLEPRWTLSSWVPERAAESLCFPMNYAFQLLTPFVFRLEFGPEMTSIDGEPVTLDMDSLVLHFKLEEDVLQRLFVEAEIGEPPLSGISVFANALPVMNVDLKAWEPHEPFEQFVRTSGMKPLGPAGIYPYRKAGQTEESGLGDTRNVVFAVEIDAAGPVLNRYALPGETDTEQMKQFYMWTTHGDAIAGRHYRFNETPVVQPLHKASALLESVFTIMPCFGGCDCAKPAEADWYNRLILSHAIPPQKLLYRDTLMAAIDDLVGRLGYRDVDVLEPATELRVVDGARQRVTVAYMRNRGGKTITPRHLAMIRGYLNDRAPIGSRIMLEMR